MTLFTPELKHHILLQYQPYSRANSFEALARRYAVNGGKTTIQKWRAQWKGNTASLQHKKGAGRPRKLSRAQVSSHVERRIVAANRRHEAIHYTTILPAVQVATHSDVSLRTLQRYGKEDAGVKNKHTKKRTASESKSTLIYDRDECECNGVCASS